MNDALKDKPCSNPWPALTALRDRNHCLGHKTNARARPERFKHLLLTMRGPENIRRMEETVADFECKPGARKTS
jgi:hypothetical protein